jgi:hypothetical protein
LGNNFLNPKSQIAALILLLKSMQTLEVLALNRVGKVLDF